MFDRWLRARLAPALDGLARPLDGIPADAVTWLGLGVGLGVLPVLAGGYYLPALGLIGLNRLLDGLDGALARRRGPTAYGAYLDIVCDMLFYGAVVMGMGLARPGYGLWSALLLFGFLGTSSSFLAYAALGVSSPQDGRGLYFLAGLAEGGETIAFFCAFCLFPRQYPLLAASFAGLCFLTTFGWLGQVGIRLKGRGVRPG